MPLKNYSKQDEKYNPDEQEYHKNFDANGDKLAASDKETVEGVKEATRQAEERAASQGTTGRTASVKDREITPADWTSDLSIKGQKFSAAGAANKIAKRWAIFGGISLVTTISGLIVGGVMGFFVNLKELAIDFWSRNHYSAYSKRAKQIQKRIFQVPDENCKSVRCRLKVGVSDKEIAKYRKAGLNPEVGEKGGKKYIISLSSVDRKGNPLKVTESNFKSAYNSSSKFRGQVSVVSRADALVYRGGHALKTYAKFGVSRGKSALVKSKEAMRRYVYSGGEKNVSIKPAGDEEDEQNKNAEILGDVDESIQEAADAQRAELEESNYSKDPSIRPNVNNLDLDMSKAVSVGEGILKGGIKGAALGIFSALDNVCSAYQIVRTVVIGAKILAAAQLIKYAAMFMTNADALKTGEIPVETIALLAGILVTPSREQGPDYGKTVANSNLFSLAVAGGKVTSKTGLARFTTGTPFLTFLQEAKKFMESFGANRSTCQHVKSWYGQVALFAGGILTSIFTGGLGSIAGLAQGAAIGAMIGIMTEFVTPLLVAYAAGTLSPGPDDPSGGFGAGEAIGAGVGALSSELGKGGEMPLTNDDATGVELSTQKEMALIKEAEHEGQNPFSLDNPDSITNRLAMTVMPFALAPAAQANYQNLATLATSPLTMLGNSVNQIFAKPVKALATNYGGQFCADEEYREMNLLTDAYCNPIYGLQDQVLEGPEYEPEGVVNYMLDEGHINDDGSTKSGDFEDFLKSCVDSSVPLSPDGGGVDVTEDVDTSQCVDKDKKFNMFRLYVLDTNILDGIQKSADDKLGVGGGEGGGQGSGSPTNPGGFAWPIKPSSASRISSCMNVTDSSYRIHTGLDVAAPLGTPITAVADGGVVFEGKNVGGFQYYIAIRHADGSITGYGHNQTNLVKVGDEVKQGQEIATVGSRGQSTGPHLHLNYIPSGTSHFANNSNAANPLFNNLMPKPDDVVDQAGCMTPQKLKPR